MRFESKLIKIGKDTAMILPPEVLSRLDANAGDTLFVLLAGDGSLQITANDPSMVAALEAGKTVMDENIELLQGLR